MVERKRQPVHVLEPNDDEFIDADGDTPDNDEGVFCADDYDELGNLIDEGEPTIVVAEDHAGDEDYKEE